MNPKEKIKTAFKKEYKVGAFEKITAIVKSLSFTGRIIFGILSLALALSVLSILLQVNKMLTVEVPAQGGSLTEGLIGTPRFINPLLAISDSDRDLSSLVYSGLLKATPSGALIDDLASGYEMSPDGLTYTFHIKPNARFQDGAPVTADDVIFTISKAQDPALKSPKRPNWDGVTVEKLDNFTVKITLKQPYPPFLENATLGILPMHIWKNVSSDQFTFSEYNIEPVGSGPYEIGSIKRNSGGIPVSYDLKPFKDYALGRPYISDLVFKFYAGEDELINAYQNGDIESLNSITPEKAAALKNMGAVIATVPLPRVFGVFFNQNQAQVFALSEVRAALNEAIDRKKIVDEVLNGYGNEITQPIPGNLIGSDTADCRSCSADFASELQAAKDLLQKNGWKPNQDGILQKKSKNTTYVLKFSISTSNAPELKAAAEIIKEDWEQLGAQVDLNFFDIGDLNQNVIRPRKYDTLLFGEVIGRDLDLFAFWHSSQRNDPGLNIALYTNIKADKLLETARTLDIASERNAEYEQFEKIINDDVPAVFLYSPDFIYIVPKKLQGLSLGTITVPSERFLNVNEWYVETDSVWKIFAH